jgi:hypothetical protein
MSRRACCAATAVVVDGAKGAEPAALVDVTALLGLLVCATP